VDVAQDAIITELDCGTKESKIVRKENALGIEVPISKNIRGRVVAEDIVIDGKVLFKKMHLISKDDALAIENAGVEEVRVFSPLVCQSLHGICQKCYGLDMAIVVTSYVLETNVAREPK
jgi:DNA-directed RNA polymerase subunit beta'